MTLLAPLSIFQIFSLAHAILVIRFFVILLDDSKSRLLKDFPPDYVAVSAGTKVGYTCRIKSSVYDHRDPVTPYFLQYGTTVELVLEMKNRSVHRASCSTPLDFRRKWSKSVDSIFLNFTCPVQDSISTKTCGEVSENQCSYRIASTLTLTTTFIVSNDMHKLTCYADGSIVDLWQKIHRRACKSNFGIKLGV